MDNIISCDHPKIDRLCRWALAMPVVRPCFFIFLRYVVVPKLNDAKYCGFWRTIGSVSFCQGLASSSLFWLSVPFFTWLFLFDVSKKVPSLPTDEKLIMEHLVLEEEPSPPAAQETILLSTKRARMEPDLAAKGFTVLRSEVISLDYCLSEGQSSMPRGILTAGYMTDEMIDDFKRQQQCSAAPDAFEPCLYLYRQTKSDDMACGIFLSEKLFSYDLILSETLDEGSLQKWFFRSPEEWNRQLWKGIGIPKHYPLSSLPLIQCVINPEGEVTQILYPRQIPNKLEAAIAAQIDAIYNTNR